MAKTALAVRRGANHPSGGRRRPLTRRQPPFTAEVLVVGADTASAPLARGVERALDERSRTYAGEYGQVRLPDSAGVPLAVIIGPPRDREAAVRWLRDRAEAGHPTVALGAGAGELVRALGGGFAPGVPPAFGWRWVTSAAPEVIAAGAWLHWETRALEPPTGAEVLAENADGAVIVKQDRQWAIGLVPQLDTAAIGALVREPSSPVLDTQGVLEATAREWPAAGPASAALLSAALG